MTMRRMLLAAMAAVAAMGMLLLAPAWGKPPASRPADPPAPATRPAPVPGEVSVTVFQTGDIHEKADHLAKIVGHVKQVRQTDPNVLLLDAGDQVHQYGDKELRVTDGEAMYRMMLAGGYDGIVFGNHDHGMGRLRLIELKKMMPALPMLAANIDWKKEPENLSALFPAYKIVPLRGVRVAIIGASSDEVRYTRKNRFNMYSAGQAILTLVPVLRKQADIVIAITHADESIDWAIASDANAPDLIVGGHSHGAMARGWGSGNRSYILKAGRYSRNVSTARIRWAGGKIIEITGAVLGIDDKWPDDEQVKALREGYRKALASRPAGN